jgi:sodium-dependent dicarboxylate transporter 2/3/5
VFVVYPVRVSLGADAHSVLAGRRAALGPLRGGEAWTLTVFGITAVAWVMRERKAFGGFEVPGLVDVAPLLTDGAVGILGALSLFVLWGDARDGSRRPLLTWREAREIPWDVLLLFGGGLSLAAAMDSTGLSQWLGEAMTGLSVLPPFAIYLGLAITVLVLSELASNTAVASMVMPLSASLASAVDQPPLIAGFAASTGFAMPVATPPNTIVFGSGQVTVPQMAKAGLLLDVIGVTLVVLVVSTLYPIVFG